MFVDNSTAMTGVYEVSGIKKEIAIFEWDKTKCSIAVSKAETPICLVEYKMPNWFLPKATYSPRGMGILPGKVMHFKGVFHGRLGFTKGKVEIPSKSHFCHYV